MKKVNVNSAIDAAGRQSGFTVLEVVVVIICVGILAALVWIFNT